MIQLTKVEVGGIDPRACWVNSRNICAMVDQGNYSMIVFIGQHQMLVSEGLDEIIDQILKENGEW